MRGLRVLALGAPAAALLVAAPAAAAAPPLRLADSTDGTFASGEAIVRFEPGTSASDRGATRRAANVAFERSLSVARTQVVSFDGSVHGAAARLEQQPKVAYAQPNYRYRAQAAPPPNDPFFTQLWGLGGTPGVGVLSAWDVTRGASQVIAVADTGIDLTHDDLAAGLWSNPGEVAGNGIDDDGNGKTDDVRGYDFVDEDPTPDDYEFHGTHVAGTAAARAGNAHGVAGVAPDARVMAVRVLNSRGFGLSSDIGEGISYAAREGAGVVNLSLSGPAGGSGDQFLASAVNEARTFNTVVVAAAGNDGTNNDTAPVTPCTLPADNLICVTAVNQSGGMPSFANTGRTTVDVAAPGVGVLSTKTDYVRMFEDDFNTGLGKWAQFAGNTSNWGIEGGAASDSPGVNYVKNAYSELDAAANVDLSNRRGCRLHFSSTFSLASNDFFFAGVFDQSNPSEGDGLRFTGSSGTLEPFEAPVNDLDGRADVRPFLAVQADANSAVAQGAIVDDLRLLCRDNTYLDATTSESTMDANGAGNYVQFSGTSMATPHVAGIAALVKAAAPGLSAAEVIAAIRTGAQPLSSLAGRTVSGGTASAPGALSVALGQPIGQQGTTTQPAPGATAPPGGSTTTPTPTAVRPGPAGFGRRFAVDRRGRLRMRIAGEARLAGVVSLSATTKALAARRVRIARARFTLDARGRATVRLLVTRRARRALRRGGTLRARAAVELRNAAGLRSMTFGRIVLVRKR